MQLKPKDVAGHLARGLAPVYIVAGEEPLLIEETLDAIRATARKKGYSERDVFDADRNFDWNRVREAGASLSLFATRRIVEVRMSGSPNDGGVAALVQWAGKPQPDVLLLVSAGRLDSRVRGGKWYTALENAGAGVYAWPVAPRELPGWIADRLKAAGLSADAEAIAQLVQRTEGNLLAAAQDVEKLKLLFPSAKIGGAEIRAAVADSARFDAFDLADKMLDGDAAGVSRSLARLREEGEELPAVVGALAFVFRQWAKAAEVHRTTGDPARACDMAGVMRSKQPFFINALKRGSGRRAAASLRRLVEIDIAAKSGAEKQGWEDLLTCCLAASGVNAIVSNPRH